MFHYIIFDIEVANSDAASLEQALKEVAYSSKKRVGGKTYFDGVVWPYQREELDAEDAVQYESAYTDFLWSCFVSSNGQADVDEFIALRRVFEAADILRFTTKIFVRANLSHHNLGVVYFDGSMSDAGCSGVAILCKEETFDGVLDTYTGLKRAYRAVGAVITDRCTNNVGELNGMGFAVELTDEQPHMHWVIIGDSEYTLKCFREWRFGWAENSWRNSQNKTIANVDLIKHIAGLIEKSEKQISFKWTKGHAGNPMNELCDQACKQLTGYSE